MEAHYRRPGSSPRSATRARQFTIRALIPGLIVLSLGAMLDHDTGTVAGRQTGSDDLLETLIRPSSLAGASGEASSTYQRLVGHTGTNAPGALLPFTFGPVIVATMGDSLVGDHLTPGEADPGDTLRYTVVITNSGDADALDVVLIDTIDANTTLVPGSVVTTPIAINDTASATGNVPIEVAAPGLLTNDAGSGLSVSEVSGSGANVGVATSTTLSGSVTVAANGSFAYQPPVGIEGTDTFTYAASGPDGSSNQATVYIQITDMVWFIDNSDTGSDEGTFLNPFKSIAAMNTANGATGAQPDPKDGDLIALRTGGGTYVESAGITLRDSQKLIGEGVAFDTEFTASANSSAAYQAFAGGTDAAPVITPTAGNGINLGSGNTLRGFTIGNTLGAGIAGLSVGTLTVGDVTINGTGEALDIDGGSLAATFLGISSTISANQGIDLNNVSGTMTISGATSLTGIAGNGIDITSSTAAFHFAGGLNVATTGSGSIGIFAATDTITVAGVTNTVSSPPGTSIDLDGVDLGPGVTFNNVSSSGGAGINLNNVSGTLTIVGGEINSGAGIGVRINGGASNVSIGATLNNTMLKSVEVTNRTGGTVTFSGPINDTGTGIDLTDNSGSTITFSGTVIVNVGSATAFNATGGGTVNVTGANSTLTTTTGVAVNIVNTTIGSSGATFKSVSVNGAPNGIVLNNTGSSGDFTVTGDGVDTSLGGNDSGGLLQATTGDAIDLDNTFGVNIRSMRILTPGGDGIDAFNLSGTSSIRNSTITDVDATNTSAVRVQNTTASLTDLFVEDSRFTNALTGQTMFLVEGGGAVGLTMQVRVDGNEFSDLAPAAYQHTAGLAAGDNPTVKTFFTNNSVIDAKVGSAGSSEVNLIKGHSANSAFVVEGNSFHDVGLFGVVAGILNVGGNSAMNGGTITGLIKDNEFSDLPGRARAVNVIVEAVTGAPGLVDITIDGNKFDDLLDVLNDATAIHVEMRNDAPNSNIRIVNNSIGTGAISNTTPSAVGGSRDGVFIQVDDAVSKTMNLLMSNNTIQVTNTGTGATGDQLVEINADDNLTRINATITGNVFNNAGTGDVSVRSDVLGSIICLDLNAANTNLNAGNQSVVVVRDPSAAYEIEGMAAGPHTDAAVEAFLGARNTIAVDAQGDLGGGFGNNGGAACPEPPPAPVISPVLEQVNDPAFSVAAWDDAFMIANEPGVVSNHTSPDTRVESSRVTTSANDLMIERAVEQRLQVDAARSAVGGTQRTVANASANATSSGETVNVMLGTLPVGASVQITFDVAIDDPFPPEVSIVCTQGTVSGLNFPDVLTDDPDDGGDADPTCTPIVSPPLPVELVSFDYLLDNGSEVLLRWSTASETDNAGFEVQQAILRPATEEIEHDQAGRNWNALSFVTGAGTTTQRRDYSYAATLKEPGLYGFRLKQIDLDGGFSYSPVLEVDIEVPRELMLSQNYPNPFNPSTRLTFSVPVDGRAVIEVYNILGQQVARLFDGPAEASRIYALTFEGSSLSTGDYVAVLRFNGRQIVRRMVLMR